MDSEPNPRPSRTRRLLLAYLALLALSHGVRWLNPPGPEHRDGSQVVGAEAVDLRRGQPPTPTRLGYSDLPARSPDAPTLVLLHGSPMDAGGWRPLIDELRGRFRLIVPDLHGSGASERHLPDYSSAAAAALVDQLLDELDLGRVHLAGFSTGATVALHLSARRPGGIASLSLMAPLAIEKLEMVGDHTLNNAIYWAQKFYIWCGINLLPHFGALDRVPANLNYARHYHHNDTRRLDEILPAVDLPVLILHGGRDLIRPSAASRELARLLPQSDYREVDGGHLAPIEQAPVTAEAVADFVAAAEDGSARTRARATAERVGAAGHPFEYARYHDDLRARVMLMVVLLAIATLISEDITCITAGILASRGVLGFVPATTGCFLGILIGDVGLYLLGRSLGTRALRVPPLRWMIKPGQIEASERFFARWGAALVVITRWLPGMRIPTYVGAGMLKLPFPKFLFYFVIAAAIWTPLLVGLSTAVGGTLLDWLAQVEGYAPLVLVAIILTVWVVAKLVMGSATRALERRVADDP